MNDAEGVIILDALERYAFPEGSTARIVKGPFLRLAIPQICVPISSQLYRHYKGKLHRVHFVGIHSETLEPLVCYESLYRNRNCSGLLCGESAGQNS